MKKTLTLLFGIILSLNIYAGVIDTIKITTLNQKVTLENAEDVFKNALRHYLTTGDESLLINLGFYESTAISNILPTKINTDKTTLIKYLVTTLDTIVDSVLFVNDPHPAYVNNVSADPTFPDVRGKMVAINFYIYYSNTERYDLISLNYTKGYGYVGIDVTRNMEDEMFFDSWKREWEVGKNRMGEYNSKKEFLQDLGDIMIENENNTNDSIYIDINDVK